MSSRRSGYTQRELQAQQRQQRAAAQAEQIAAVAKTERELLSAHRRQFKKAEPARAPAPAPVDRALIEREVAEELDIPRLALEIGGNGGPPTAPPPQAVDVLEHYRRERVAALDGIPLLRFGERRRAVQTADGQAEAAAAAEDESRRLGQEQEQARLDARWEELQRLREHAKTEVERRVKLERERREQLRLERQAALDAEWTRLLDNDPEIVEQAIERTFSATGLPAALVGCAGGHVSVLVMLFHVDELPERTAGQTPTGKPTLKKRSKTDRNHFYFAALASTTLGVVRAVLAAAPGIKSVTVLATREEPFGGGLSVLYEGTFERAHFDRVGWNDIQDPAVELEEASDVSVNFTGRTDEVAPIGLDDRVDLQELLTRINPERSNN